MPIVGENGDTDEEMEVDESLLAGFSRNQIPTDDAIIGLANNLFPDCEAITFLENCIIVELPATDTKTFRARLPSLPMVHRQGAVQHTIPQRPVAQASSAPQTRA
jgi:hypothetical protein